MPILITHTIIEVVWRPLVGVHAGGGIIFGGTSQFVVGQIIATGGIIFGGTGPQTGVLPPSCTIIAGDALVTCILGDLPPVQGTPLTTQLTYEQTYGGEEE